MLKNLRNKIVVFLLTLSLLAVQIPPKTAHAADPAVAKVSFTFDDGFESSRSLAAPTLAKYGIKGTIYVSTGCVNGTGSCRNNVSPSAKYISWDQVKQLQNTYGWEVAAHTVNHKRLSTLSNTQKDQELSQSKQELLNRGFNVKNFASPEGDYDYNSLSYVAKYYQSHRGFWDQNVNSWPYNNYILNVKQVQVPVSVSEVTAAIDQAVANKQWVILVFHDIKNSPSSDPQEYEYATAKLDQIASYVKNKQSTGLLQAVTVDQALSVSQPNILPNSSFSNGIGEGWTADSSTIAKDTSTKGSFPSASDAIVFNGGKPGHLYSPYVPAIYGSTYGFKAFVNTLGKTNGEFGFYVDEYDANGNWNSGKWLGAVWLPTVSEFTAFYTPSWEDVKYLRIQTYFSGNPAGKVYADNLRLYNITANQGVAGPVVFPTPTLMPTATPTAVPTPTVIPSPSATPSPTPAITITVTPTPSTGPTATPAVTPGMTPTPTPVTNLTNLVTNGTFEQLDNGWAVGWQKDSDNFAIDTHMKGNDGTKSLYVATTGVNAHVISDQIAVESAVTYRWLQWINTTNAGGEFGFYIDEYDAAGNWISGQWKGMLNGSFSGVKEFSYTPTSSNVKTVRLQYYVVANSTFDLYLDSVFFGK